MYLSTEAQDCQIVWLNRDLDPSRRCVWPRLSSIRGFGDNTGKDVISLGGHCLNKLLSREVLKGGHGGHRATQANPGTLWSEDALA